LRHTFATELANSDVSVYTLMKLLGHESMVTSQRYVTAAGDETRTAAPKQAIRPLDRGSLSRIGATSGPRPYRVGLSIMSNYVRLTTMHSVSCCAATVSTNKDVSGADCARHTSKLSP
jgi:hypothetical protein